MLQDEKQAKERWDKMFDVIYPKYQLLFSENAELCIVDKKTLKTFGENGKEYILQIAPWSE